MQWVIFDEGVPKLPKVNYIRDRSFGKDFILFYFSPICANPINFETNHNDFFQPFEFVRPLEINFDFRLSLSGLKCEIRGNMYMHFIIESG